MVRALVGLAATAILGFALAGCSDDDGQDAMWWEDFVSYVPAQQLSEGLTLTDVAGARERFGVTPEAQCVDGASSDEEREALSDLIAAVPDSDLGLLAVYQPDTEDLIGFNVCRARRIATAGLSGTVSVYEPDEGTGSIPQRLTERRYSQREHRGSTFFALGADYQPSEQETAALLGSLFGDDNEAAEDAVREYLSGLFSRVLVDDGILVRASTDRDMQGSIDAHAEESGERDDEVYAMARALGEFHAATFLPSGTVIRSLDEQVEMILGSSGAADDPAEFERLKSQVIANILEPYQDWGRLPPFERFGLAYQRASNGDNVLKVALPYRSESDAVSASDELSTRMDSYESLTSRRPICQGQTVSVAEQGAVFTVLMECQTERPGDWRQIMFQDSLFLVEELDTQ